MSNKKFYCFIIILFSIAAALMADTPKLDQKIFAGRRAALMAIMEGGIAVLHSPEPGKITSFGTSFRQSSNLFYLTGLDEPNSAIFLIPGDPGKYVVFIKEKDLRSEMWDGKMVGTAGAKKSYGADQAFPYKDLQKKLGRYLRGKNPIYCDFNNRTFLKKLIDKMPRLRSEQRKVIDIAPLIHEMRLIKSDEEIRLMREVTRITAEAQMEAMKATRPGMFEYQIEAVINYIYQKNGCKRPGFKSIVASGANAAIMHYQSNNRKMARGDLLLMDIGAEYGHYSADITRTIPVSGKFSKRQKEIYRIVLEAQKKGIRSVAPGKGIHEVIKVSNDVLINGLYRLGLITDKKSPWQTWLWLKYFQSSHWLGLDTHDVGDYTWGQKKGRMLEPGMVFTIEPGIYIGEDDLKNLPHLLKGRIKEEKLQKFIQKVGPAFEKYKNVCIRIEDDILVTPEGYLNLSKKAPKEIKEIERLMKKSSRFR